jgi:hypothetical protein
MMAALRYPHPGEILKHEFLEPTGLSQKQLARAIGVPPHRIPCCQGTRPYAGGSGHGRISAERISS